MEKFAGFRAPYYTQVPDELFDTLMYNMGESELKVLLYIIRRTYGFKKQQDRISLSQFVKGIVTKDGKILDRGTGLSKPSVEKGLKEGVERGTIKRVFCCPDCGSEIKEEELVIEKRIIKGNGKEIKVVPKLCPFCNQKLRGQEGIYYSLNIIDEDKNETNGNEEKSETRSNKESEGGSKNYLLGVVKNFNIQDTVYIDKRSGVSNENAPSTDPTSTFLSASSPAASSTITAVLPEILLLAEKISFNDSGQSVDSFSPVDNLPAFVDNSEDEETVARLVRKSLGLTEEEYEAAKAEALVEGPVVEDTEISKEDDIDEEAFLTVKEKRIAEEIAKALNDYHSWGFFRLVARHCPSDMIYRNLGLVKEEQEIKRNKGAMFTYLMKMDASAIGIDLSGKSNSEPKEWGEPTNQPKKIAKILAKKLGDPKGFGFYYKAAKLCPLKMLRWAYFETMRKKRVKNKPAYFNRLLLTKMKQAGADFVNGVTIEEAEKRKQEGEKLTSPEALADFLKGLRKACGKKA
jgi:hypothetical protein